MINIVLSFLVLFGVFFFGIKLFRDTTEKQKWQLTKLLAYSILCAVLTLVALSALVIFF